MSAFSTRFSAGMKPLPEHVSPVNVMSAPTQRSLFSLTAQMPQIFYLKHSTKAAWNAVFFKIVITNHRLMQDSSTSPRFGAFGL